MFNKSSFCHIASNNRNDQKGSVFIYKTTDTLAQVTQSGYFNEKLIDINVHDLIIHVQYDPVARTLKKSVLIVTERTLDNVETTPILDQTIVEDINQLGNQIDQLGDQVAGIEEKIPENASAQNQLATKSEIPTVPTNISAFNNDSGYITSSALTPYATTQALNDGLATKQPAGDYATNSALTSGLALKVAIAQGAENAGKILKIDDSGNVIVADESGGASLPILTPMWFDHIANDVSWLRADTFSWQSGDVYTAAYEHLAGDYENATTGYSWRGDITGNIYVTKGMPSVGDTVVGGGYTVGEVSSLGITVYKNGSPYETATLNSAVSGINTSQTETIGDITITYYLSEDGHKICLPDQESNIVALYEATGVAWYYILDTTNRQFKLPRTKWGFTGIRSGVGGYVAPGLPDHNHKIIIDTKWGSKSANNGPNWCGDDATRATNIAATSTNASQSNSIYGNSDTVQPPATQMYLYFYVGNFVEDITTIDAGKLAEVVNDFDIDTFKPQVDEAKNSAITGISDAKTNAIDSLTNLATDLGTSLKYGNVGDIFYTSRLDVSLNGAVECNGNLYNTTDFGGAQSIGNLLRDSKVPYISLTEHQTTVDTYGSCRCFGWDGGTEFRVPKLADVFIEAGVAASEGEFISAGLPNITGKSNVWGSNSESGALKTTITGTNGLGSHVYSVVGNIGLDASKSNAIYGNSTTVQPPAVRYRAMVQLAFGATDDAVVTAGNVVADVSELNAHKVIAFQAPTSANGYTWYRKYADGWVEQGGVFDAPNNTAGVEKTITLPLPMTNDKYTITIGVRNTTNDYNVYLFVATKTSTTVTFKCNIVNAALADQNWQVSGMSAQ